MPIDQILTFTSEWLSQPATLDGLTGFLAEPLGSGLASLGIVPETRGGVITAIGLNTYALTTGARIAYSTVGRYCGIYNPNHFRHFLWVPWRPVWKVARKPLRWFEEFFHIGNRASGGWASLPDRLVLTYKPGDIFLGRHRAAGIAIQQPAGVEDERHVAIIAGPGSGKTTHAITWVAMHPGNAFIIDPKGQIARITAKRKGAGGPGLFGQGKKVRVLDPLRQVKEHRSAKWNLFATLHAVEKRSGPDAVVRYAAKAAKGLVLRTGREANPFWPGISEEFLTGAILDVFANEPKERQTLGRLYDLICGGLPEDSANDPMVAWLWRMKKTTKFGGAVAASANALAESGKETYGNILVTIREHLQWLKLPEVRRVCDNGSEAEGTDVNLEELVTGDLVLYVCAPAGDIRGPLAGWFRLLTVMGLYIFEDMQKRLKHPTLFLLDEFPALGRIESIQVAAGLMRSMSVRLAIIAQDAGQLRIYENHETFLGSATCLFMGSNHQETLSYIERATGLKTVRRKVEGGWISGRPARYELREEPVIRAEAAKRVMGRGNIIVIRPDERPLTTKRTRYFDYAPTYFFDNDRDHKEKPLRRWTRQLFTMLLPGGSKPAKPLTKATEA